MRRLRGRGGSLSECAKAGAAHLPRNACEARRRYPADEASRDGPRAKAAGGRGARAGAGRRARRNGVGRAAELDQRCHARPRSGPQPSTPKQIDGELRRTATRSCICIQRAVAWTRKSPKLHRAHGCPDRGRTLEGRPAPWHTLTAHSTQHTAQRAAVAVRWRNMVQYGREAAGR